jgi:hypothetical protein
MRTFVFLGLASIVASVPLLERPANAAVSPVTLRAGTVAELVNAINTANISGKPTIIRVSYGHYLPTGTFPSTWGLSLLPMIQSNIQIIGAGPSGTVIDGSAAQNINPARLFNVSRTGQLSLSNLTLTRSVAICTDTYCSQNGGGAIYNVGTVSTSNVIISSSAAVDAQHQSFNYGGAIFNVGGHLDLEQTTLSGNGAVGSGGALAIMGGTAILNHCLVQGNSALFTAGEGGGGVGQGIYVTSGSLTISNTTITGNTGGSTDDYAGASGLGIYNTAGTVSIQNSAITENTVQLVGTSNYLALGTGGGIYNGGTMTIVDTTIGGNVIGTLGGGIDNGGHLTLQGVTISDNTVQGWNGPLFYNNTIPFACSEDTPQACIHGGGGLYNEPGATLSMATTVIAGNISESSGSPGPDIGADCAGVVTSNGHNAVGDETGCTLKPSSALEGQPTHDLVNVNAKLGALQDDGVPGNAHYPLLSNSPLINAGGSVGKFCTTLDQIGEARANGICAIGAIQ